MTLRTGIPWLDRDLTGIETCYLYTPHTEIRQALLQRAVTTAMRDGPTLLLSPVNQKTGYYSFEPDRLFPHIKQKAGTSRENLTIQRVDSQKAVTEGYWAGLEHHDTILVDRLTNLRAGKLGERALERAADGIDRSKASFLLIDTDPPFRALSDAIQTVERLSWDSSGPVKERMQHPDQPPLRERIRLDGQKTLHQFAEAALL
ncbi:MAG: hypothetical protein SV186_00720 [Candidatus Nanohaloarchaea archaeon]|nr:hypothetical protein [Candidatus Nanohaloarchaea archaeon]